ncbi:MAG: hypothetical protein ACRC33_09150 [Gemmataceae bacterium]
MTPIVLLLFAAGPPAAAVTPVPLGEVPDGPSVNDVQFSPDGRRLAACGRVNDPKTAATVCVWDAARGGKPLTLLTADEQRIYHVRFSPGGELFGLGYERCVVWDAGGRRVRALNTGGGQEPPAFGLADGGREVLVGWGDRHVRHDAATGATRATARRPVHRREAFGPAGGLVATLEHQDVDLYSVKTGALLRSLRDHPGAVTHVAVRADERQLASAVGVADGTDDGVGAVWLWGADGTRGRALRLPGPVTGLALSDDGRLVAVTLADGLRVFEAVGGEVARLALVRPTLPRFGPGGRLAALEGGRVRLWALAGR